MLHLSWHFLDRVGRSNLARHDQDHRVLVTTAEGHSHGKIIGRFWPREYSKISRGRDSAAALATRRRSGGRVTEAIYLSRSLTQLDKWRRRSQAGLSRALRGEGTRGGRWPSSLPFALGDEHRHVRVRAFNFLLTRAYV